MDFVAGGSQKDMAVASLEADSSHAGAEPSTLDGVFAPYPTGWKIGGAANRELLRTEWDDCIAKVPGDMTFPWRVFGIARRTVGKREDKA